VSRQSFSSDQTGRVEALPDRSGIFLSLNPGPSTFQPSRRHELRTHLRQWVGLEEKKRLISRPFVAAAPHSRHRGAEEDEEEEEGGYACPGRRAGGQDKLLRPAGKGLTSRAKRVELGGQNPGSGVCPQKLLLPLSSAGSAPRASPRAGERYLFSVCFFF